LPELWNGNDGNDADRCVPVFPQVYRLRHDAAAEARRLLRFLFLWLGALSAGSGRAFRTGAIRLRRLTR